MPLKIDFLTDVSEVIKGTDDIAAGLDKVADDLDNLGKNTEQSAKRAGRALEDGLEKGTKNAGRDVSELDKRVAQSFREMADTARRESKKIGDSAESGFDDAAKASGTFRQRVGQNMQDLAGTFDGSAESIVSVLEQIGQSFMNTSTPVGILAGTIGIAAVALAKMGLEAAAEEANAFKESVGNLAAQIDDAGGSIDRVDFATPMIEWGRAIQDTKEWWEIFQGEAKTGFDQIQDQARKAGTDWTQAFRGTKGSMQESQRFLATTAREMDRLNEVIRENSRVGKDGQRNMNGTARAADDQRRALEQLRGDAQANLDVQRAAVQMSEDEQAATEGVTGALQRQIGAKQKLQDVTAGGIRSELDLIETMQQSAATIATNGQTLDKNTEAGRANWAAILDIADGTLQFAAAQAEAGVSGEALAAAMEAQRAKFIETAGAAGMTTDEANSLADQLGLIPTEIVTKISEKGSQDVKDKIAGIPSDKLFTLNMQASGLGSIQQAINGMNGQTVWVNVQARPGQKVVN